MTVTVFITLTVVALALGLFVFRAIPGIRAYFEYRGKRLITCPETHKPEAVDVAAGEVAVGAFLSEPTLRLKECSRWPERQDCGQECLQQIEIGPANCLVWNIVSQWYEENQRGFAPPEIPETRSHVARRPVLAGKQRNRRQPEAQGLQRHQEGSAARPAARARVRPEPDV